MVANSSSNIPGEERDTLFRQIGEGIFNPRSVAVIGASRDDQKELSSGWVGRLVKFGYRGTVYPINPKADSVLGLKAYPSVSAVPGPIDYVIVAVPAEAVPEAVAECVNKEVKAVHVFTAGFGESEEEAGIALQKRLESITQCGRTRLIGPNCMGIYAPAIGLSFDTRFAKEKGTIGFLSQSGVGGRKLIHLACERGLRFSKAVSYGNALDLDGPDFLEYFVADPDTKQILVYVEGVKQGRRFFNALRQCRNVKPVVILKGGMSESGAGAVASHTASLAGSRQVWEALFRQTRLIRVDSFEEAVEQLVALVDIPPTKGRNVGLVGRGGGFGVIAADMCEAYGLRVPRFAEETRKKLARLTPAMAGSSVRNPVEIGLGRRGLSEYYADGLQTVAADPQIDLIITYFNPEDYIHYGVSGWAEQVGEELVKVSQILSKPFIISFMPGRDVKVFESIIQIQNRLQAAGIPCFSSLEVAIKAVSKLVRYYESIGQNGFSPKDVSSKTVG